mmetsp:Transcript_28714/g.80830  ORF Transcript_28714/g.80830 Transcript_28714/m.80830 type:complete len:509 (+) Transcript_28714:243-1769(+)
MSTSLDVEAARPTECNNHGSAAGGDSSNLSGLELTGVKGVTVKVSQSRDSFDSNSSSGGVDRIASCVLSIDNGTDTDNPGSEGHGEGGLWHHAAAHMMTVTFGAGVLSLPYALRWLGLTWGLIMFAFAVLVSYRSAYLLASMVSTGKGAGATSYRDLAFKVLGKRAAWWIVTPLQWSVLIGTPIVYFILGGESLLSVYDVACDMSGSSCPTIPLCGWTLIFTACCMLLAPAKSIHEVRWVSALAAIMSLTYGLMAIVTSAMDLAEFGVSGQCDVNTLPDFTAQEKIFQALNAIGIIVFAFGGLAVLPEVQATLKPDPTTKRPMMKGYIACAVPTVTVYIAVSVIGFLAYGPCTKSNILLSAPTGSGQGQLIAAVADLLVTVHVFGSIQVFTQPVMQTLQSGARHLLPLTDEASSFLRNPTFQRYVINLSFIAVLGAIGAAFPDASGVIGLVGGIGITSMTLVIPTVMFVSAGKGECTWLQLALNATIILLGTFIGLLATVGAGYTFTL